MEMGLKSVSALACTGTLSRLLTSSAYAATPADYKALICVFLNGGNDPHNLLVPIKTANNTYAGYASVRGQLALPLSSLLPVVTRSGDQYGLHPALSEVQNLYVQGKAAILANVGVLVEPIPDKAAYFSGAKLIPGELGSHAAQTQHWQTACATDLATTGWGGRLADYLGEQSTATSRIPTVLSMGSPGCFFCQGEKAFPGAVGLNGPATLPADDNNRVLAAQQLLTFDSGLTLAQAANSVIESGASYGRFLTSALASAPRLATPFPGTVIGKQLQMIARVISARAQLGATRQIFYIWYGDFDTHANQLPTQQACLKTLSPALAAFYAATDEMGVSSNVTTFTTSEFGRTLMPNSAMGTDHGWGGHQMIIGGAVTGGDVYGSVPELALNGADDISGRGLYIPKASVDQYAGTLAEWFGVTAAAKSAIFPNLAKFAPANLGFLA